ncbi:MULTISPECIES: DUF1134 domain-containing protein [Asticcacaulis]|uniref:DUF1134 domain-containing protein n=1 Tax=Asticcacaulis TaxID=76890 RepID=UPI001AE4F6C0|nr:MULTISPECIES: DUF1134 domain-containing protein [Asticcacaulis]MBP2158555.1 hypothetical protein [Asticcacaulis solisilvae]MDR6799601.1 hypothetical protein [Asticcacaulis sp. BE141]
MERRTFLQTSLAAAAASSIPGLALAQDASQTTSQDSASAQPQPYHDTPHYNRDEILQAGSDFLGVTVEALGGAVEKIFADYGDHPTAYIAGEEASGAIGVGVRYGKGNLFMKSQAQPSHIYWQGPSIGFDTGANASRVFTLVYNLNDPMFVYRRYPGVEGSAYFIGGLGVTYQRAEGVVLTPIRAGVGFRLGASVGYMNISKKRRILPL